MDKRLNEKLSDFGKALLRLSEAIDESKSNSKSSTLKDGVIQRFEFCYEICWKLIKYYLESEGIQEAKSPKSTFREGFKIGIIEDGEVWIDMLNDRNLTSHVYDEEVAFDIYEKIISKYFKQMNDIYVLLKSKVVD
ncbi:MULTISPECIES: nucleotidyltransferase substrate binding protein [Clostridium]|jgi:nucleotidyltransferase substrate binding protein, HI0074 family|nr:MULTISPECIES: nucleotidyltransferase substrate binding protein [Clostridium]MBN7573926.1 nucleotidyltransferase substrate binding protein [Clostridium beijerinckii]MBN7577606.1 nucleotidyltransferase substrate binding protein [Clostridium beijerinckii]MBN7583676.1 nucleotidyltransferase substrate binding protein [Clostridium beijerinckii]MBO0519902.1 nucleotidyltransferase substrate binding protein [Clostridium beijerinckii]MZK52748.1 nucleotidyltransferase [Clostridium beijerinckii]